MERKVELTVGLPMYKSRDIAWLALESLYRQNKPNFYWELIICEEYIGESSIWDYINIDKLKTVNCISVKYIKLKDWIPLSQKWATIGNNIDDNSNVFILQSSDCYSHCNRIINAHKNLASGDHNWLHTQYGFFYDIKNNIFVGFNSGLIKTKLTALDMSCDANIIRNLPPSNKEKGIDNWIYSTIRKPLPIYDTDPIATHSLNTNGFNKISDYRLDYMRMVRPPFNRTNVELKDIVPLDIYKRLISLI